MTHDEFVAMGNDVLLGIDKAVARQFYTSTPLSVIKENTGEVPCFEKAVIGFAFLAAPVSMIAAMIWSFFIFAWWGLAFSAVLFFIYLGFYGDSSRGSAKLSSISLILIGALGSYFFTDLATQQIRGLTVLVAFSLWCSRFLYSAAEFFMTAFIVRNRRAFEWLSDCFEVYRS